MSSKSDTSSQGQTTNHRHHQHRLPVDFCGWQLTTNISRPNYDRPGTSTIVSPDRADHHWLSQPDSRRSPRRQLTFSISTAHSLRFANEPLHSEDDALYGRRPQLLPFLTTCRVRRFRSEYAPVLDVLCPPGRIQQRCCRPPASAHGRTEGQCWTERKLAATVSADDAAEDKIQDGGGGQEPVPVRSMFATTPLLFSI